MKIYDDECEMKTIRSSKVTNNPNDAKSDLPKVKENNYDAVLKVEDGIGQNNREESIVPQPYKVSQPMEPFEHDYCCVENNVIVNVDVRTNHYLRNIQLSTTLA